MTTESARIRARLSHPLIDGDSHIIEYMPVLMEHFKTAGGEQAVADFSGQMRGGRSAGWYQMTEEERRYHRTMRAPWWALPTKNTYDRCTAMLPKLYHERMRPISSTVRRACPGLVEISTRNYLRKHL